MFSKKYMLCVLKTIKEGKDSFTSIQKALLSINPRTLSTRLTELEKQGFIKRIVSQKKPIKITYELTKKGGSFGKIIQNICKWIQKHESAI